MSDSELQNAHNITHPTPHVNQLHSLLNPILAQDPRRQVLLLIPCVAGRYVAWCSRRQISHQFTWVNSGVEFTRNFWKGARQEVLIVFDFEARSIDSVTTKMSGSLHTWSYICPPALFAFQFSWFHGYENLTCGFIGKKYFVPLGMVFKWT